MMGKPKLLDLFCGAGGAGKGYQMAGFEVVGVDIKPQKNYPFKFIQADALLYAARYGHLFDAIHASPPCQAFTLMAALHKREHPNLIPQTRALLQQIGKPHVIENVSGAPLHSSLMLCGSQFGLKVYRHRFFEVSHMIPALPHHPHRDKTPKGGTLGNNLSPKGFISVVGNFSNVKYAQFAMGIDWMIRDELSQAIPPAYTEYIGRHLLASINRQ